MKCFFQHDWEYIDVTQGESQFICKGDVTCILMRCKKCHDVQTKTINGRWTMDQLNTPTKGSE